MTELIVHDAPPVDLVDISTELRFPEGPVVLPDGDFLVVEVAGGNLTRVAADGAQTVVAHLGGGPNGAAIGPDGKCYVCNNGGIKFRQRDGRWWPGTQPDDYSGGRIERVDLDTGKVDILYTECDDMPLKSPNDLVFDTEGGMWFTDTGKTRRYDRDRGAVFYASIDGTSIERAISPMETPNGIGLSPDQGMLYVAETGPGRLWRFEIESQGKIRRSAAAPLGARGEMLAGSTVYQHFDSLAVDAEGWVCVATVINGGITAVSPDGSRINFIPLPDEITTNICFGGKDLTTAYATLGSTGRLVAFSWLRPGLALNF